jgi:hypothetical protein
MRSFEVIFFLELIQKLELLLLCLILIINSWHMFLKLYSKDRTCHTLKNFFKCLLIAFNGN